MKFLGQRSQSYSPNRQIDRQTDVTERITAMMMMMMIVIISLS